MKEISVMKKLLPIILLVLIFCGCTQQERVSPTPVDTEDVAGVDAERVVEQFVEYYNQGNATGVYSLHSRDVKLHHPLSDIERVFAVDDNNCLNVTEYNVTKKENKTVITANMSAIFGHKSGWLLLTFEIVDGDSPKIDNWVLDRIKRVQEYHGPRVLHFYPCSTAVLSLLTEYNNSNSEEIYGELSDSLKENYKLKDVREEVEFARKHNVSLAGVDTYSGATAECEDEVRVDMVLKFDGKMVNTSTNFSCECVHVENKIENSSFVVSTGHKPEIETWVFDELRKEICVMLTLNESADKELGSEGIQGFLDCYGGDGRYSCGFDVSSKEGDCWVTDLTGKDRYLSGQTVGGWKINVWDSISPPEDVALSDQRVKKMIEGKEYEVESVPKQGGHLADVYIHLRVK